MLGCWSSPALLHWSQFSTALKFRCRHFKRSFFSTCCPFIASLKFSSFPNCRLQSFSYSSLKFTLTNFFDTPFRWRIYKGLLQLWRLHVCLLRCVGQIQVLRGVNCRNSKQKRSSIYHFFVLFFFFLVFFLFISYLFYFFRYLAPLQLCYAVFVLFAECHLFLLLCCLYRRFLIVCRS